MSNKSIKNILYNNIYCPTKNETNVPGIHLSDIVSYNYKFTYNSTWNATLMNIDRVLENVK